MLETSTEVVRLVEGAVLKTVGCNSLTGSIPVASATLYERIRFWFFERFGERTSEKTYIGHGDFTEINSWNYRGRFYPCDLTGTDLS